MTQVLGARDELVREGGPIVLLHSPKAELGTDDEELEYDAVVFVPAGDGKKIDENDVVEVSPTTVKREEHGFIRGRSWRSRSCPRRGGRWSLRSSTRSWSMRS